MKEVPNRTITTRDACAHVLAVSICTGVLFLFVALTYSQIVLPRYTTNYTEKDVQQVVNLIITVSATVIGILFSHCRRLTNEAETKAELRHQELTIPRLHVHFEAASGSKVAMGIPVARNKEVWRLVGFYFLAMMIFAFIHSVLSVIFVIEATISEKGEEVPVAIPLSIDIPPQYDACIDNIVSPACTYSLALQALSSQLVTYQDYTIAGVTFEPPNGTMGLPYYAMKHFQQEVRITPFQDARRRYCLPVLDNHLIKCTEKPINHSTCESIDGHFVRFLSLNTSSWNASADAPKDVPTGLYKITSPFPNNIEAFGSSALRVDNNGKGVMVLQQYQPEPLVSLVGGADAWNEKGYGTMLHRLMYHGAEPDYSGVPDGATYDFAARCELTSLAEDNVGSSWRQVDFTLESGVLRANITEERCPNARAAVGSGFVSKVMGKRGDLGYALQGAGAVISSADGYSRFLNIDIPAGRGTNIFGNISRLDAALTQVYHLTQTFWSSTSNDYAMKVPRVHENPIIMLNYPHLFVVRISWTPTTYIGLAFAILIALNSWVLTARWVRAIYRFGFDTETWNLLRPVDLMAYTLAASQDVFHSLNTKEHRKMEMHGTTRMVLREHVSDFVSMMAGAAEKRSGSESFASTPVREYAEKDKVTESAAPGVSVRERDPDLERGK